MDAAEEFFKGAEQIQHKPLTDRHKPLTDRQWVDAVECYQQAKAKTDAVNDLIKAFAERAGKTSSQIRKVIKARADSKESEVRYELQGTLELLGGE